MTFSEPIRDVHELRLLHDIRRVAHTLGLRFPLSEEDAANVGRIVREKLAKRERIKARLNGEIPAVRRAQGKVGI